jgi:long-chain acyl-CoA synthetase
MSTSFPTWFWFNPLGWVFVILDIVLMLITFKWLGIFKSFSPPVAAGKDGSTRLGSSTTSLANEETRHTAWDRVKEAIDKFGQKRSMGTRKFLGDHVEAGVRFPRKKFGAIGWRTYNDVANRARSIGKGLIALGMKPLPKDEGSANGSKFEELTDPHTVLIYEETSADWLTFLFGAWSQSLSVATSYATLGISSVADAVIECNVKVILCNHRDVTKVVEACATMPSLTHVVYTDNNITAADFAVKPKISGNVTVMSLDELVALGAGTTGFDVPPAPDNMAVVMYTSGSTGKPKGVMLRHSQVCASIDALKVMAVGTGLTEGVETYLAYLPAAHILELAAETTMFCFGAEIGYSDPKTISSKGACRLDEDTGTLHEAARDSYPADETKNFAPGGIQAFRPTFMAAVPKIWDILKKGVEDGLGLKPGIVQGLMKLAFAWRAWMLSMGMDTVFFMILIKKLRPLLGGRQKVFVTGGGPIAAEVQTFVRTMLGAPLVQGYALTETSCSGTVQYSSDPRNGVVGPPVASVEIKLRDCLEAPEGNPNGTPEAAVLDREKKPYLTTDRSHYGEACVGRGEVLIRGPAVGSGYLKQADKTAESFDEDGWFHSGDIAIFTPDGCIKIVDRLKNLVKLKGGEYIAIESMEKEYSKSIFVNAINGGIMCYGDGSMDRPVALVQANIVEVRKVAAAKGLTFPNDDAMCNDATIEKVVLEDLIKEGVAGGISSLEKLLAVKLISGHGEPDKQEINSPWTPDNEYLTASNKLNRKPIQMGMDAILAPLILKGIR